MKDKNPKVIASLLALSLSGVLVVLACTSEKKKSTDDNASQSVSVSTSDNVTASAGTDTVISTDTSVTTSVTTSAVDSDGSLSGNILSGFFWSESVGYKADGTGHYCAYYTWENWLAAGGPSSGSAGVTNYDTIPSTMTLTGECAIPEGFFWSGNTGYYSRGTGHYCNYSSWSKWLGAGGPSNGSAGVPNYASIPSSMIHDGFCP